jgi:hypothetical protein
MDAQLAITKFREISLIEDVLIEQLKAKGFHARLFFWHLGAKPEGVLNDSNKRYISESIQLWILNSPSYQVFPDENTSSAGNIIDLCFPSHYSKSNEHFSS